MPISCVPESAVSTTLSVDPEPATEVHGVDFDLKTLAPQVPANEGLPESQEKSVAGMFTSFITQSIKKLNAFQVPSSIQEGLVASKAVPSSPSSRFSNVQREEFEMVKGYLAKLAADFEWQSTASQGLKPTSEDCVIGLSAYITAFGFEKASVSSHLSGIIIVVRI